MIKYGNYQFRRYQPNVRKFSGVTKFAPYLIRSLSTISPLNLAHRQEEDKVFYDISAANWNVPRHIFPHKIFQSQRSDTKFNFPEPSPSLNYTKLTQSGNTVTLEFFYAIASRNPALDRIIIQTIIEMNLRWDGISTPIHPVDKGRS